MVPSVGAALLLSLITAVFPGTTARLVDVPYVSQTRALCGGAAAAMVLRYWGEGGVHAEDFRALVDPEREAISTEALTEAVRERGWWTAALRGDRELVGSRLAAGQPLVVLLEEGPERYHYVVVVGFVLGHVVVHDPARAPYRLIAEEEFYTSWGAGDYWTLLILPGRTGAPAVALPEPAPSPDESGCSGLVEEAVRLAREGDLPSAERLLTASNQLCPHSSAPVRELAGIRFRESRWEEAGELARQAVKRDPADDHAWRILAATRFLRDDREGALHAWNRVDEPRVDLVKVDGLVRTRYEVVAQSLDFPPGKLVTEDGLWLARRRLSELPIEVSSRVSYRPLKRGMAEVESSIVERPLWPGSRNELLAVAADAAVEREISLKLASPTGGGELWSGSGRFWEERPKVSLGFSVPRPFRLPGIWRVEGYWERQAYGAETFLVREERRRASLAIADWRTAKLRWDFETGLDHWKEHGRYGFFGGGLERRLASDRAAVRWDGSGWFGPDTFGTASLLWTFRSSNDGLLARGGLEAASHGAPPDLWSGAGTGHARLPLLRAHPLLEEGVLRGEAFGRKLAQGGVEARTWLATKGFLRMGLALFADLGKAWSTLSNEASDLQVDVGAGLRLKPIGDRRTLRIDAAWGVRDGEFAISAGWMLPWPGWR
jgi:hypothetical protein